MAKINAIAADDPTPLGVGSPRVSVITPFFNAAKYIRETIESVLAQTYREFEYILVDDGSTDGSSAIVRTYVERYPDILRYAQHDGGSNRGVCASRNLGLGRARGELIALVDADDVWVPNKLREQLNIMELYPEVGMVCGATCYWSSWQGGFDQIVPSGHVQGRLIAPPEASVNVYPLGAGDAPCPSDLLIKKALAVAVGGFEEQFTGHLQLFEDQAFLSKLYLAAPVFFSNDVWLRYRVHSASCMSTVAESGKKEEARQYFFNWFSAYLTALQNPDPNVVAALKAKRRQYNPESRLAKAKRKLREFGLS